MNRKKNLKGPEKDEKPTKEIPKLNKAKAKALELIKKEPNASLMEIGRKLKDLGLIKKPERVYELTRNNRFNTYIVGEIEQIRQKNLEVLSREIVPEALKIHKKVLKDKNIEAKAKKDWVAMAERAEFHYDEAKRPITPPTVNIGQIQAIIAKTLNITKTNQKDNDPIDIKPE